MGGRPRSARPEGWGKEYILWWLQSGREGGLSAHCAELAAGVGLHPQTLYQEVCDWKRTDPEFAAEYLVLDAMRSKAIVSLRDRLNPDWRERWGEAFLEHRSKEKASRAIGTTWTNLWSYQHQGHANFDADFARVVTEATQMLLARHEEKLQTALDMAEEQEDAKTMINGHLAVLERLDKKTWSRSEERQMAGRVEHHHVHEHRLSMEQQRAFAQALATSARFGFAQPAAAIGPGGETADVVDVVPERVEARR
jgi:hypothetical protein